MTWRLSRFFIGVSCAMAAIIARSNGIDELVNRLASTSDIGIEINDLTTHQTLYQRHQNHTFIPASNMKLFSNAAAIMVLGPDYRFKNYLSMQAQQLQQGVLTGTLYLQLAGDPSFTHQRLNRLITALKSWHINRINGNVVIDSTHTSLSAYAPGWLVNDLSYSYGAPIAPVMIDANRLSVTVNPGSFGKHAVIEVNRQDTGIEVTNQVLTKASGAHCGVNLVMDKDNRLSGHGCINVGQLAVQQNMAIKNPLRYAQGLIRQQLIAANITLNGEINLGRTPHGAMLIATDTSKTIAQLMADTLKPSDNLYADSLFLHAAYKLNGSPVDWPKAAIIVKQFIQQQTGINMQSAVLTDGSGLSRHDQLTPAQTVGLLQFLYARFPLAYEYIAALPVSGRDGTLERRFKKPYQQDLVRAKTGTMTGVASLSGYLFTANAHILAFAIFINHRPGSAASESYRHVIDRLCTYLLGQKPLENNSSYVLKKYNRLIYQLNLTQAAQQRQSDTHWRRLETLVRLALKSQPVTVVYRSNELVLEDNHPDSKQVMVALQTLRKKHEFSLSLTSKTKPILAANSNIFWTERADTALPSRIWTIRKAMN